MGDPRAAGAQIRTRLPSLTPLEGKVAADILARKAQNSPLLGEHATARIAQLNLLDALFVAVAQRDRKSADANLSRTMCAVQSKCRL